MVDIGEFIKRLEGIEHQSERIATGLLFERGKRIVELNNAELMKGKNTEGGTIQKGYSRGYSKLRQKKGLQTRYVDLYFTGKFQKSSKAVKVKGGLDIDSDAEYEKYLRGNYPNIRGLNKQHSEKIADEIAEELAVELKKYLVG